MAKKIPHRAWHEHKAAKSRRSDGDCDGCQHKRKATFLHHCHLADYAKERLRTRLKAKGRESRFPAVWQRDGTSLFEPSFDPVWVCPKCNEGDGWAKVDEWCNLKAVYPQSFSMLVSDLREMQSAAKGLARRETAQKIWARCKDEHTASIKTIDENIEQLRARI